MPDRKNPSPPPTAAATPASELHEQMLRRATNHNAHLITAHGTVQVGRKGRTGKAAKGKKEGAP